MKPGYQTTEFWICLASAAMSGALGYLQTIDAPWAVVAVTVTSGLYTLLRASLKAKTLSQ